MSRLTIEQKAQRVLGLLCGLRNPRVAEVLSVYGFTEADLEQGWVLLRGLSAGALRTRPRPNDPGLYVQLDAWENRWLPVADATLRFRYPVVHAWLFRNLDQTHSLEVTVSVGTFVERLRQLPHADLANGRAARELLSQRGLGESSVREAERLLRQLQAVPASEPSRGCGTAAARRGHEAALWQWYVEWSAIVRAAIHDRRLLRSLGFTQPTRLRMVAGELVAEELVADELVVDALSDGELLQEDVALACGHAPAPAPTPSGAAPQDPVLPVPVVVIDTLALEADDAEFSNLPAMASE